MIVNTDRGPAVAVVPTRDLVHLLATARDVRLSRVLPVPAELDELVDDAERALLLRRLADVGNIAPIGTEAGASCQWMTVSEVHAMTGVPVRTLRYRCGRPDRYPSARRTPAGYLIHIDDVLEELNQ